MRTLLSLLIITLSLTAYGQSCLGKWVTIDDETNKKKSIVELYKEDGKMYGKITYLFPREGREPNAKCKECKDDRKNEPLLGLQIVRDLEWDGGAWKKGTIVDPEDGKVYTLKMWIDKDNNNYLNVRGYIGPFYRTQKWVKIK